MRKWIALAGGLLVFVSPAPAAYDPHECNPPGRLDLHSPSACTHNFLATKKPKTWVATRVGAKTYATMWKANGRRFHVWEEPGCRFYANAGPVHVREVVCDGRIIVTVRTEGPPQVVHFAFEVGRECANPNCGGRFD